MLTDKPSAGAHPPILIGVVALGLLMSTMSAFSEDLKFHDSTGSSLPPSVQTPEKILDFVPENYSPYLPTIVPNQWPGAKTVPADRGLDQCPDPSQFRLPPHWSPQ